MEPMTPDELRRIADMMAWQEQLVELSRLRLIEKFPEKHRDARSDRIFLQYFGLCLPLSEEDKDASVPWLLVMGSLHRIVGLCTRVSNQTQPSLGWNMEEAKREAEAALVKLGSRNIVELDS